MDMSSVSVCYHDGFQGTLQGTRVTAEIGEKGLAPYDMLLGGLSGCFYVTFLEIAEKKRLHYEGAEMEVAGIHREGTPRTLQEVSMILNLKGAREEDREQYEHCCELAKKYCSIHATIAAVAEMKLELRIDGN